MKKLKRIPACGGSVKVKCKEPLRNDARKPAYGPQWTTLKTN